MKPETSEPRKFSPSPRPTTSGELRRAATTTSGWSACTASRVKAPSSRWQASCMALVEAAVRLASPAELVAVDVAEQRRGHLGVRLGVEGVALAQQLRLQLGEVFDDAVVDQRPACRRPTRCGCAFCVGRPAVGCPARVADPGHGSRQRVVFQLGHQVAQLARLLAGIDPPVGHHGDSCGVIAAVFQPAQPLQHYFQGTVVQRPILHRRGHGQHILRFHTYVQGYRAPPTGGRTSRAAAACVGLHCACGRRRQGPTFRLRAPGRAESTG